VKKLLFNLKIFITANRYLIALCLFYFLIRLINLTKLPIFNDEAIYLDWGFRETHNPGFLYYSLYDAKQPFLMWIFGISENIFSDPLLAGRVVSVLTGFITFLGLYKLSREIFSKEIGFLSVFIYSIVPIFSFFDRQALMESAIGAIGIWVCFFLIKNLKQENTKNAIFLGVTLGIGFFIKSTTLIFIASFIFLSFVNYLKTKKKIKVFENFSITFISFLAIISLLLINPSFWATFSSNSRYSLTFYEILSLPIYQWLNNFSTDLETLFLYLTPLVFILSLLGVTKIFKDKNYYKNIFLVFFIFSILLDTILIRVPLDRYLVSFLPFLCITFSYFIFEYLKKYKTQVLILTVISVLIPFYLTIYQLINPASYILSMSKFSPQNDLIYVRGFTSGYGINQTVDFLKQKFQKSKIIIGVAENTGNPESAMQVYFNKDPNAMAVYFDSRLLSNDLNNYDCLSFDKDTYFVSRDNQLAGLDKFLQKIKIIKNPYGGDTIGVYKVDKNCKGKSIRIKLKSN